MNTLFSTLVLLLALEGPVGHGIPPVVARFGGENMRDLPAIFARHPEESIPHVEIIWFLDGGALSAPVATSRFVLARTWAENPILTHGSFSLDLPVSEKTETYRGLLINRSDEPNTAPLARIQLVVFPPDSFARQWAAFAAAAPPLTLIGELPGLREFLHSQGIKFTEGSWQDPGTVDRNGMVVVGGPSEENFFLPSSLARAVLVFAPPGRSWTSTFAVQNHAESLLWLQRPAMLDFSEDPLAQAQFLHLAQLFTTKDP